MTNFNASMEMNLDEGLAIFRQKAAQAQSDIMARGLVMPRQPMVDSTAGIQPYRGELPPDLTALNDAQLGTTLGLLSEWNNYVQAQLAEVSGHRDEAKASMEFIEAKLRIVYQKDPNEFKKRSNPERDDYVNTDPRFVEAKSTVLYWDKVYYFVKAITNAAEQSFSAVSRRITQRGQEIDRMNRSSGTGQNTNINPGPIFGGRR